MTKRIVSILLILLSFSACQKRLEPGLYFGDVNRPIRELSPDDVLMRVNGEKITKNDYLVRRRLIEKIYRTTQNIPLENKDKKVRSHMESSEQAIPMELLRRVLMRQASDKAGLTVSASERTKAEKKFMKFLGKPKWDLAVIDKKFGEAEGVLLRKLLDDDVRFEKLRRLSATNDYTKVSEEQIKAHQERIRAFTKNAERLNKKARQRALKFRERVLAGADFAEETEKSAQLLKEYGREWESFQLMELQEEVPLRTWLATAKPGDISEPIDLDDGLAIIKCVAKTPVDVPKGMAPVDEYTLVRCTFYAYQPAIEQTDEQIRQMLSEEQRNAVQQELGLKLMKSSVVEFPNGSDFFGAAAKQKAVAAATNLTTVVTETQGESK